MVKEDAPKLLRKELNSKKWTPQILGMSGVTDCYQPIERRCQLTRQCLEVLADFRNPVWIITKNRLVTRDIDLLQKLESHNAAAVAIAVTTLDAEVARVMEPRASTPTARLTAIRELTEAGIPTAVLVAPVVPGLTDHEMPAILAAAREAGAIHANYTMLRLPHGLPALFENWLTQHFPEREGQGAEPGARNSRRRNQRPALRQPHERRRRDRGGGQTNVQGDVQKARVSRQSRAVNGRLSPPWRDARDVVWGDRESLNQRARICCNRSNFP